MSLNLSFQDTYKLMPLNTKDGTDKNSGVPPLFALAFQENVKGLSVSEFNTFLSEMLDQQQSNPEFYPLPLLKALAIYKKSKGDDSFANIDAQILKAANVEELLQTNILQNKMLEISAAKTQSTATHSLEKQNYIRLFKALRVDLNYKNEEKGSSQTALIQSVRAKNLTSITALMEAGADWTIVDTDNGYNAVTYAALLRNTDTLKHILTLIDKDKVEAQQALEQAVFYAATYNKPDAIKALATFGVSVNEENHSGTAPLIAAAKNDCALACKALLDHGANIDVRDFRNRSAYELAQQHPETQKVLADFQEKLQISQTDSEL